MASRFLVVWVEGHPRPVNSHFEWVDAHFEFVSLPPGETEKNVALAKNAYWIIPEDGSRFAMLYEEVIEESRLWT